MRAVDRKSPTPKVAVIGPECTGKTDLSSFLAEYYKTAWVKEYARAYLDNLNRPYDETDLLKIAHGQLRMEDEWSSEANRVLICDTNLIVIKIWSEFKYGRCDQEIIDLMQSRTYDLTLLTFIDIPWQDDPQREHPDERQKLWDTYVTELQNQNLPFVDVKGERDQRRSIATSAIDTLLSKKVDG
ncbi:MAG: AAA family ATPase [Cyclobacteriaceae bacterium]